MYRLGNIILKIVIWQGKISQFYNYKDWISDQAFQYQWSIENAPVWIKVRLNKMNTYVHNFDFFLMPLIKSVKIPSRNTQFCFKGLLMVRYFCFWAIWLAGPVLKKKLGADYEGSFFMFSGAKKIWINNVLEKVFVNKWNFFGSSDDPTIRSIIMLVF